MSMSHPVAPKSNATRAPPGGGPFVAVFFHLKKCAGTTVRNLFINAQAWAMMPYCQRRTTVAKKFLIPATRQSAWIFWEFHCFLYMDQHAAASGIAYTLRTVKEALDRRSISSSDNVTAPTTVASFTVLRHPATLAMSEYYYWHRTTTTAEAWLQSNPELLLNWILGVKTAHGQQQSGSQCDRHEADARRALDPLDHIAFVEAPETFLPIQRLARFPTGVPIAQRDHLNADNTRCHSYLHVPHTRQSNVTTVHYSGSARCNFKEQWDHMSEAERRAHTKLQRLAESLNWCSIRIYHTLRAWKHESPSGGSNMSLVESRTASA